MISENTTIVKTPNYYQNKHTRVFWKNLSEGTFDGDLFLLMELIIAC